jgi:signal peptidase II
VAERHRWFAGKGWFWIPIAPLVALDLWSKAVVFTFLQERYGHLLQQVREHRILEQPFGFSLVEWRNTGTIWGLGQGLTLPLILLRFVALGFLVWFAARTPSARRLKLLVLGAITAGAIGNLHDNLTEADRAVRDFLLFYVTRGDGTRAIFPAFNVADSCITVGAIALLILLWREDTARGARG